MVGHVEINDINIVLATLPNALKSYNTSDHWKQKFQLEGTRSKRGKND